MDARRTTLSRPANARIPNAKRMASLPNLRKVPAAQLPTSFQTPGPGAYTQFADFGLVAPTPRRSKSRSRVDTPRAAPAA